MFAVAQWISAAGGNILDSQQFTDISTSIDHGPEFFLRMHFDFPHGNFPNRDVADDRALSGLREAFGAVATQHQMAFGLVVAERPLRTLILVSKEGHCLNDLLYRQSTGALNIEIPAVVSNHRNLEGLASSYKVPFHHLDGADKPAAEAALLDLVEELAIDFVVLARYMQVLSDGTCQVLEGRAINIHHSFLPSFKGARPYQQAHDRGVKLIGATAHYVTAELDDGPIIDQGVLRVDHRMDAAALARAGRDVESKTLSRAVQLHAESRVLMHGPRTVVFG